MVRVRSKTLGDTINYQDSAFAPKPALNPTTAIIIMGPARTSSQPSSSQNQKQKSIISFFTPKSSSANKPSSTTNSAPASSPPAAIAAATKTALDEKTAEDSEEDVIVPQRRKAFKSKRDIEYDNDDVEPASKRARTSDDDRDFELSDAEDSGPTPHQEPESLTYDSSQPKVSSNAPNGLSKPRIADRTSRYIFSSSPIPATEPEDEEETEESRRIKEQLHQQFVKKLGRPDSIAEIKRRNRFITDEPVDGEEGLDDEAAEEEEPAPSKAKGKKGTASKKGGSKLTPMEKQILEIKRAHADTVLVVEVGYKFRFFGEDARVASKELGIVCIPGKLRYDEHPSEAHLDKFASASIPVHRLHVHVKRLVAAGHKVGVVRQLETAALKAAGDNRNAPFVRKLTNLYTKATYIDDAEGLEGPSAAASGVPATGFLLCITETNANGWATDERVQVGMVAVQPTTGDIIYDDFEDGFMRSEIETRLLHIAPCEFLIVGELSKASERLVKHLSSSKTNVFGDQARVERVEKSKTMAAEAYSHISNFYAGKMKENSGSAESETASHVLDKVHQLSQHVTICLSAMITHMSEYGLEHVFDLTKYFQPFSARSHMLLNGNTLTSLEIYQNQSEHSEKGSLFWTMDRTKTRFGHRMLRRWVGRPLLDKSLLERRIEAVEELKDKETSPLVEGLSRLLSQIRADLEKSLIRIYYKKCTRPELLGVLQTLQQISNQYAHIKSPDQTGFDSLVLGELIATLPRISENVIEYLERINLKAAKDDDKYAFFIEDTENITDHKLSIAQVEHELDEHRKVAAEKLKQKKVEYVTVSGIEYLIEVLNTSLKNVPASWAKISGTKKVSRFHTPEVVRMLRERDQHKEALAAACDEAFTDLLDDIASKYQGFRDCIQALATLDALLSLASLAGQPGYVKPTFTSDINISVEGARHPMVEQLLLDSYVPNSITLSSNGPTPRALLITGPNMGGKSSFVRSVALVCIMGQIGSYVPATSATLPMLDAVFTRMGAQDNMMKGESTFMVELSETADILKQATPRSLVILDELGRGTSTHDGVAIASAVLDYMVRDIKALTLFITHYQSLGRVEDSFPNGELRNVHMKFKESGESSEEITFLYEVGEGMAHRSYGLNVARLANVPDKVLHVAKVKSAELEERMRGLMLGNMSRIMKKIVEEKNEDELEGLLSGIEQL